MSRFIMKKSKKVGLSPGTLIHIGERKVEEVEIFLMNYDQGQLLEKELKNIKESYPYKDTPPVSWINIDGLHDVELIGKVGQHFEIHPLTLEDVVNTGQRPKAENFEDYIYVFYPINRFKFIYPI